jgi:transposase
MSKLLVEDELWELVVPLLPSPKPRRFRYPGRKPLENRAALTDILFILKSGLRWNDLLREMSCGSGAACWVRLHEWHKLGVWASLHRVLLAKLRYADKIDWSRAAADSTTIRALRGGDKTGKTPTDRGSMGTRDHLLTDGGGIPLSAHATGANRHEATQLETLLEEVPAVAGKPGRPRQMPEALLGERAFDSQALREWLWERGIIPLLARRGEEHGSGLGIYRYVVERTLAWFKGFRRLRLRYERTAFMHAAVLAWLCAWSASVICKQTLGQQ